jgi:hypothetical protein
VANDNYELLNPNERNPDLINLSATGGDKINRAWVNFTGVGTVAITDSFGVDSITDNGVGDYTTNLTSGVMTTADYVVSGQAEDDNAASATQLVRYDTHTKTTAAYQTQTGNESDPTLDASQVWLIFAGGQ